MTSKKEQRRDQLLQAAASLFAEKGYHAVTIDDIVGRLQIARGTFYLYFADKRAVLSALVEDFLARLHTQVRRIDMEAPETPVEQLRSNFLRAIELALAEPELMQIVLRDSPGVDAEFDTKVRAFMQEVRDLITLSLEDGQESGLVRPGDRDIMAAMALGAAKELLLEAVVGDLQQPGTELAEQLLRFVANGALTFPV